MKPAILVLCTGNSARSQMGEGLFRHYLGDRFEVYSAGTKPSLVRPEAIAAMAELGIDISHHRSKPVDEFLAREFAYIVTVCDNAKENCPYLPGAAERVHWSFEDPAAIEGGDAVRLTAFRRIRDQIRARVEEFSKSV
jgi:arsenate reductase